MSTKTPIVLAGTLVAFCIATLACSGDRTDQGRQAAPVAAAKGLTADDQMQIGPDDRCPVCAMRVSEHPKFSSAIELDANGAVVRAFAAGATFLRHLGKELLRGDKRENRAMPGAE